MQPGDVVDDRFELERVAGSGGMGEVWRARDRATGMPVAVKVLTAAGEGARERFQREATLLSELAHPCLARYVAHGVTQTGALFIAAEWLEGEDLATTLEQGALGVDETIALLVRIAGGLGAAHHRGIVHRDVKPANVFLPGKIPGEAKLIDFGIARVPGAANTAVGALVGTAAYMAPEQARGDRDLDPRVDVFALGCIAFECLTGVRVFSGDHVMAVLAKVLLAEPPRIRQLAPHVPAELEELVLQMLSKDRQARPPDGGALEEALSSMQASGPRPSTPAPPSTLTRDELRVLSVVLAMPAGPSAQSGPPTATIDQVRAAAEQRGAKIEWLADGSVLVTSQRGGVATDVATQLAKCSLDLRQLWPEGRIALATGRSEVGRALAGEVIDRAARLLAIAPASDIAIDDATAALLDSRFDIRGDGDGIALAGERASAEAARTLLGKRTSCVGRDREIAALEATLAECIEESVNRAVLLTAPAGTGKTRVASEFVAASRRKWGTERPGIEVWSARADPMRAGSTYGLVAEAVRRAAGISEAEPAAVRRDKLRARVARHVPEAHRARVAEFLGEMIGAPFPDDESVQLRGARQDAMLMADQVRAAWLELISAECAAEPLLLVLEDLHWGDLATVKLIDSALGLRGGRLMVLALTRPEVHDLFPGLWADRALEEIRLGGLTRRSSERLVRQVLGDDVPDATVADIVARADGNAFYLEELIRAVAEGRGDALPDTVVAMVHARLERLEPAVRRVLRAASVYGQTFLAAGIAAMLGGAPQLDAHLMELEALELVTSDTRAPSSEAQMYAFRHALVRDGAYASLTDADRRLGHGVAGAWLEGVGERDAMVLAEHFERGGQLEHAVRWYPRAAEQALEANDLEGALRRADKGIAGGAAGHHLGELLRVRAEAHNWLGENAEAERLATEAMALLPPGGAAWYVAAREAVITGSKVGAVDRVAQTVEQTRGSPADDAARGARRIALAWGATALLLLGRYATAEAVLDELERDLASHPDADPRVEAVAIKARAIWAVFGNRPEAIELFEASLAKFEQAGDLRNAACERDDIGFLLLELGAYEEAERHQRQALADCERLGMLSMIPQVKHNIGFVLMGLGDLEGAERVERECLEAFGAQNHPRMEGLTESYLAMILLRSGDAAAAEDAARRGCELLRVAPASRGMALAVLAQALLAQEKGAEALEVAREAIELLRSLGAVEEGEVLIRLAFAETLHAAGSAEAASAIADARDALLARAARIGDPNHKKSFLERVDANARTLALAEGWSAAPGEAPR